MEMESPHGMPPDSPVEVDDVPYPCKGCGEILEEGKAYELSGNRWHIDCFRCNKCNSLLDSEAKLLLLGDGILICDNCTYECSGCGNKIEELAILTGDQAFCDNCFRCRNCKRKIENLRYARATNGIYCMDCHVAMAARRRKKAKSASSRNKSGTLVDKSLPAIPPPEARNTTYLPEPKANMGASVPPSTIESTQPVSASNLMSDAPSVSRTISDLRPDTDSESSRPPTSSQSQVQSPTLTLPSTTYKNNRHSFMSGQSDLSSAAGEEFLIPLAFDPTPIRENVPTSSHSTPRALEERPRDYFNRSISQPIESVHSVRGGSPQNPLQDRSRQMPRDLIENIRSQRDGNLSRSASVTAPPFMLETNVEPSIEPAMQTQSSKVEGQFEEHIPLFEPSKMGGTVAVTESVSGASTPRADSSIEHRRDLFAQEPHFLSQQTYTIPESPRETAGAGNGTAESPRHLTNARGDLFAGLPKRGDSLDSVKKTIHRKEIHASAIIPPAFSELTKDVASSPKDAELTKSISGKPISGPITSPESQSILDTPNVPQYQNEAEKGTESFTDPRAPPPPPSDYARSRAGSATTVQSELKYGESQKSPKLPRWSGGGDFTLEEDMARILGGEEPSASFLKRVSNSVRHGRSYSAQSGRTSRDRFPRSPIVSVGSTSGQDISSPSSTSPEHRDELVWFKNQLRIEKEKNLVRERKIAELEAQLDQSASIKQVNSELKEKRSTMVVLDTQKEIVVRELEVLTEHIAQAKANKEPFDLAKMNNTILREFAESLEKLKNSFAPQIEEYVEKRNALLDEIASLTTMKEKSFSEFEQLSSKNAQLAELNNQLVHQIQDIYKSNTGVGNEPNRSPAPNGLGIYGHHKEKSSQMSFDSREARTLVPDISLTDSSTTLHNDIEPVTVVDGPNVVSIKKVAQPKKFDWRKGQKVAKGMAKGVKGAFSSTQQSYNRDLQFAETGAYGQLPPTQQDYGTAVRINAEPPKQAFGFFGNQKQPIKGNGLYVAQQTNTSTPSLILDPSIYLFGSDLEQRAEFERTDVPAIVKRCIEEVELRGMDVEGIYRKSGGNSQVLQVKDIFEKPSPDHDISDPDLDIHAVTSGLKQYFRRLPTPLITYDVYDTLLEATSIPEGPLQQAQRVEAIQHALRGLPKVHYDTLEYLIRHLAKVVRLERENLMTSTNIAVVFAPTIMRPESVNRELTDTKAKNEVVTWMVEDCDKVFRK